MSEQPEGTKAAQDAPLDGHDTCADCGRTISASWSFCPSCGWPVGEPLPAESGEVSADA